MYVCSDGTQRWFIGGLRVRIPLRSNLVEKVTASNYVCSDGTELPGLLVVHELQVVLFQYAGVSFGSFFNTSLLVVNLS